MLNRKFVKWLFITLVISTFLLKFNEVFSQTKPKAGYPANASSRPVKPNPPVTLISVSGQKSSTNKAILVKIPDSYINHPEAGKFHAAGAENSVELIQLRNTNSRTFQNPEGSFITEQSSGNLNYKDNSGIWMSIPEKCSMIEGKSGLFGIADPTNPVTVNTLNGEVFFGLGKGKTLLFSPDVEMNIRDLNGNNSNDFKNNKSIAGESNNNEVKFKNFWQGVDRVHILTQGKLETNYIINVLPKNLTQDGTVTFDEKIMLPEGWKIIPSSTGEKRNNLWFGSLNIIDASGNIAGSFEPLHYYDNSNQQGIDGGYMISSVQNEYRVSTIVPSSWLLSKDRVYPVTIDPTVLSIYSAGVTGSNHITYCTVNMNVTLPINSYVTGTTFDAIYTAIAPSKKKNARVNFSGIAGATADFYCDETTTGSCALNASATTVANGFYASGIVPVSLNVSRTNVGSGSCSATNVYVNNSTWKATVTYTVCPSLTTAATISGPTAATCSQSLNFTSTGGSGSFQWQYSNNGGSSYIDIPAATSQNMSISFNSTGTYMVRLKSSATYCNTSYSNIINVNVAAPVIGSSIASPYDISTLPYSGEHSSYCMPSTFAGTNSQGTPSMFFKFTTGSCANTVTINTCNANAAFDTYIFLLDAAGNVITSNDDYNGCAYLILGNPDLSQIQDYNISPNTIYYAMVQGYQFASPNAGVFGLNITTTDTIPVASVAITADPSNNLCPGGNITLNANPVNGGNAPAFVWKVNGTVTGTNSPTFNASALNNGDQVTVAMTTNMACAAPAISNSSAYSIIRNTAPIVTASSNSPLCNNTDLNLSSTSNVSGSAFSWSGPGGYSSSLQNSSITSTMVVNGTYTVTVTATNGCTATSSINVISDPALSASISSYQNPSCASSSDGSILIGANGGTSPFTFAWSNSATGNVQSNLSNGVYTITVTDAAGCTATANQSLSGSAGIQPVNAGIDRNVCNLFSLQLQADSLLSGQTGTWTRLSGTASISNINDPKSTVSGLSSTVTNSFRWTVTSNCGTVSDTVAIGVYTAPPPNQPTVTGPLSGCKGDTLNFVTNLSAQTLEWTARPEGVIFSGQGTQSANIIFGNTTFTGYWACVQGINACGSNATKCLAVRTNTSAPKYITGPEDVCEGSTAVYKTNVTDGATQYKWIANSGILINGNSSPYISTDTMVTVTFPTGYVSTKISVATATGCVFSTTRELSVFATPLIPNVIVGETANLCNSIKTYSVKPRANLFNEWTVPTGATITYTSPVADTIKVQYFGTVTGSISLRSRNNCAVYGPYRRLSVTTLPQTPGTITGPVNVCVGSSGNNYSVATIAGNTSYTWGVPTGSTITTGLNSSAISVQFGTSITKISVQSGSACGVSPLRLLTLTSNCRMGVPNSSAESINAISTNDEENVNFNLQAFPDADTRMLTVTFNAPADGSYNYKLVNKSEQEVKSGEIAAVKGNNMEQLDMSALPDATFKLIIDNGKESHKLNIRFF